MDRYVIRTPKPSTSAETTSGRKFYIQTTIESLQGVVVVEHVWRLKSILKLENQTKDNLLSALKELSHKIPSREVLKSTKIGRTINKLTQHEDKEVSTLASSMVKQWKQYFEDKRDKPMIEVKCDLKTEKLRKAGRKLLASALQEKNSLPEAIEREAFAQHGNLVNGAYRRTMRTLVFTLKHQDTVRTKLVDKHMEIRDFVAQYKKGPKPS